MSSYPRPTNFPQSIFSPINWPSYSDFITIASANKRYLSKIGDDTDVGNLTLKQNLYFTDSTLAIYKSAANTLAFKTNSVNRLTISDTITTSSQPILLPTGSSANCSLQFTSSTGTGMHNTGGLLYLSLGGTNLIRLQSGQIFSDSSHRFILGTAAAPAVAGNSGGTQSTGLFWTATPTINVSVNGSQVAGFVANGMTLYGNLAANNAAYTPSTFGYYQEFSITGNWYCQGSSSSGQAGNIYFTRVGRVINCVIDAISGNITNNTGVAQTQLYYSTTFPTQVTSTLTNQSAVCRVTWNTFQASALSYVAGLTCYITIIPSTVLNNGQVATWNTAWCITWNV